MFSGIVDRVAPLGAAGGRDGGRLIEVPTGWSDLAPGESVAVNGVCLTVAATDSAGRASFFLSRETLARSNLGAVEPGGLLNLERAVTLATRLSGHLVQGHVDGLATLVELRREGDAHRLRFAVPAELRRYCVPKGSVALDGVSLTINGLDGPAAGADAFALEATLIPHSWTATRFGRARPGDLVNVEVDVLGKYVEQLCQPYPMRSTA